jgi:hypothetical protein
MFSFFKQQKEITMTPQEHEARVRNLERKLIAIEERLASEKKQDESLLTIEQAADLVFAGGELTSAQKFNLMWTYSRARQELDRHVGARRLPPHLKGLGEDSPSVIRYRREREMELLGR